MIYVSIVYLYESPSDPKQIMGQGFDDQLQKCLYPILEKLGESSDIISQSAFATLEVIAETCR